VVDVESMGLWSDAEIAEGNGFVFWQMPLLKMACLEKRR
jgi:hypothetical protein